MSTNTATRRGATAPAQPRHRPAPAPARRHLRPVPDTPVRRVRPEGRRRLRPQVALTIALGGFFLILFAVALLQTVLVQGQIHLDGLRADVAERQAEVQLARDTVARLESPENIIGTAEGMGMEPMDPTYVPRLPEAGAGTP
ncbi:MAG TPA: hypothetical protein VIT24_11315 [Acidimicrobiales bacterium]